MEEALMKEGLQSHRTGSQSRSPPFPTVRTDFGFARSMAKPRGFSPEPRTPVLRFGLRTAPPLRSSPDRHCGGLICRARNCRRSVM